MCGRRIFDLEVLRSFRILGGAGVGGFANLSPACPGCRSGGGQFRIFLLRRLVRGAVIRIVPAGCELGNRRGQLPHGHGLLGVLMIYYHYLPPGNIIFLPLFVVLALAASLGVGLWIGALMVKYRDFRFIVPFIVQFGLYISPVGFLSDVVSQHYSDRVRLLYSLNPIVGVIDGFRWCLLTGQAMYWPGFVASLAASIILVVTGIWYFRKTERTFADII